MAIEVKDTHILGLTPKEQFLIKILLSNLLAGYIDKSIKEASDLTSPEAIESKASLTVGLFNKYNDITDMLCPESLISRAKPKVLLIGEGMMKYIVIACNGYDPKNNYLSPGHKQMLVNGYESIRKKVLDSAQFQYSRSEIDKANGGK